MTATKTIVIAVTGPESTGKTTLVNQLHQHLPGAQPILEYARSYLENRQQEEAHNAEEILYMLQQQLQQLTEAINSNAQVILMDTDDVMYSIWMREKFPMHPHLLASDWAYNCIDFTLLCKPDVEWIAEPMRVNPLDRDRLFDLFVQELEETKRPYAIVTGQGELRIQSALMALQKRGLIAEM